MRCKNSIALSPGLGTQDRTCLQGIRTGMSHGFDKPERTCLHGIRAGLQDLTGLEQQIQHAYEVSGWGCRISQVGNYRSYMPARYQEMTSGSPGLGTQDRTCLQGIRTGM